MKSIRAAGHLAVSFFLFILFLFLPGGSVDLACCSEMSEAHQAEEQRTTAQESNKEEPKKAIPFKIKEKITVSAEKVSKTAEDEYVLEGFVDIVSGKSRIQADKVYMNNRTKELLAEGSVLLDWGENRLAGSKLEFNLDTENGVIYSVLGYMEPEYIFTAEKVEKIAEDKIVLYKGVFTSCTQPTPYWSFKVGRALIHLNHYAHLRNILFKVRKVPLIYIPYLVWPVKEDRAAGLLFPEIGSTNERGKVISEAFFWPIRRNMDMTFYADYYSLAGLGGGIEYNFIPNDKGKGRFLGYYINDKVADRERYNFNYSQQQNFKKDFRLTADINELSDFEYYQDFERELKLSSQSFILSRVNLSRNWSYYSFNAMAERREQLLALNQIVQSLLPEVELRGRSRKLGSSPFYFSFESSAANLSKIISGSAPTTGTSGSAEADYQRFDLYPAISAPYSPFPWLDLNPSILVRETFYSKRLDSTQDTPQVVDDSLNRFIYGGTLEVIGPKFYRIFERLESKFSPLYKHSIESRIVYFYFLTFDRETEVLRFDEKDMVRGGNLATFYFRNALYAKRPSRAEVKPQESTTGEDAEKRDTEGETADKQEPEATTGTAEKIQAPAKKDLNPVEIASFEISQSYSFDLPLSSGKGESRSYSPITTTARFNPGMNCSFDLRATYDTIYKALRSSSLSASLRKEDRGHLTLSMLAYNGFDGASDNQQLTFEGGMYLFNQKLGLDAKVNYNLSESFLPEQRYRIEYYTQCCGFYFEYLNRDFSTNERREFRFAIDLKGIGKVMDFHQGFNR